VRRVSSDMAFSLVRASSVEPKALCENSILARTEGDENRSPAAALRA
jgi:hypothetical protein